MVSTAVDPVAEAFVGVGVPRRYARGQALMHMGQVPREVYLLRSGHVKVSATTPTGRELLLAIRGPKELVGELSALDDQPRSATIVAIEPVEALALGHGRFRALVTEQPELALQVMRLLTERLRDADSKRVQLGGYTTLARVAFCLLELCERFGSAAVGGVEIALPVSQDELAGWAGASLESVARALATMRGLGWIETGRRAIRVRNLDAIRQVIT
jgi:CRP/FNR family cyclic AMP-dependent transcriptional regulator